MDKEQIHQTVINTDINMTIKKTAIQNFLIILTYILFLISLDFIINKKIVYAGETVLIKTANGEQIYNTEIATTKKQLERGLMYKNKLAENEAMLFIFGNNQKVTMWMKNTIISLDMLFIDNLGKIVYIAQNTVPNSLNSISAGEASVRAVLELKGGTVQTHHINVGDTIIHKAFRK